MAFHDGTGAEASPLFTRRISALPGSLNLIVRRPNELLGLLGVGDGVRTRDVQIHSLALYQLSYTHRKGLRR